MKAQALKKDNEMEKKKLPEGDAFQAVDILYLPFMRFYKNKLI
jgi:hypothetical protein